MNLVIVESPAKAKTINKYLGPSYEVLASYGHVRDLPAKNGSVDPEADFQMIWETDPKAAGRLNDIAKALKGAHKLILATDPDREGEAISWHVLEIMKQKRALKDQKIERVVFNAITKQAVTEAMKNPRQIDGALVDAYLARRALDYLVGFTLSPVLWRKLPGARSAGRVQSVALRLVCDRELEIEKFVPREYWSLLATLATPRGESFEARLVGADGKKIQRLDIGSGAEAEDFKKALEAANFNVTTVEAKPARRNPQSPFTTSTLQQEASRKLGFAPAHTMRIAQRLYEGIDIGGETTGLITYMRTDGVQIDPSAITQARKVIGEDYGKAYVPDSPRQYTSKAKNAQEAHEAIRPTDLSRRPSSLKSRLDNDQARLYELIWMRTVASQMESAEMERTTVDITGKVGARVLELRATGQVVKFDGFLAVYQEGRDDDPEDEDSKRLPVINEGEALKREGLNVSQHFTEPPPRFSEASLVKRMEELGIGRPSTYASIIQVLKDRGYVKLEKKRLHGEDKGRVVVAFLENYFARYVEFDFTADLEEKLDLISNNEISWKQVLTDFWKDFIGAVNEIKDVRVTEVLDVLDAMLGEHIYEPRADGGDPRQCPSCGTGKLNLKAGKFGAFVGCSNYPECRYTRPLAASSGSSDRPLGKDPVSGLEVAVKAGRFGPYIQLGEPKDYGEDEKPKRAGIPKNMSPADVELELALKLLSLPRDIGPHPEDGEIITAGIGRFGPFVRHGKTYASLEAGDEVYTVGLNRAVTLIAEKIAKGPSRRFGADPGKEIGDYPARGGKIMLKKGRYGAYVTIDGINATIPDSIEPEKLTIEEAIALIEERAAKTGGKPKRAAKKAAKKKPAKAAAANGAAESEAPAKKPATKKAAAKKATPKKEAAEPVSLTEAAKAKASKVAAAKVTKVAEKKSAGKARG
ncbi:MULTISPECIES: type I DNA topoisomerase [unclassified Afipia]|uniref:type I DNA topoisomerase n=1 Tax=unclassified Afipia TaxID=2642050 RepID=UPI000466EA7F|nr:MULTISPECIES: type I DNA topoisomerase [unclassified Afipia]MAH69740.1 DNA topoisomerase I [Afipia sp.]OUX61154.1 MAG: DNA topoisomerase I [Afipia sp. TMED4]HAQ94398.1 type I DNA topoisomerase [Afipia sp.]HBF57404.1 type I DNA topoisomerase [Afipia sp.]HCX18234.1 type I DNA topoisomerase [Afipia sp.]